MKNPSPCPAGARLLLAAALGSVLCASVSAAADSVVVFNEIHYHPAAGATEWIELRNLMGVNVDMSGWRLSGGADYTFPAGTVIPGHGFLLVAAQPSHTSLAGKNALGPLQGNLSNSGENLRLRNNSDRIMDEVTYSDSGDWPAGADGSGSTLTKRDQGSADARAGNWTASPEPGGTPGRANFPIAGQAPVITSLVPLDAAWKYRAVPEAPPSGWQTAAFDDAAWTSGPAALYSGDARLSGVGEGLLAWWKFDETSGSTAANSVPGGPAGILTDGPGWVDDSIRGRVLQCTGSGYVATGNALIPRMTLTNNFTWSFWADSAESGTSNVVLGNRYSPSGGDWSPREFIKFTPAQFEFHRSNEGQNIDYPDFPFGGWVHHAVVKSGATLTYYRNGTASGGTTLSQGTGNAQPFYMGGDLGGEAWTGQMDDVALWTKALPATAIAGLASGAFTPATAPTDPTGGGMLRTQIPGGTSAHYFRRTFSFSGTPSLTSLTLRHLIDDGAVFYLNGVELARTNMPEGAVTHSTAAASATGNAALSAALTLPGELLVNGTNVLAVEVHQDTPSSPDMVFAASLDATELPPPPDAALSTVVFNEISGASDPDFRIELLNTGSSPVSLAGWSIRASSGAFHTFADGTLPPGGLLSVNAATLGFTPADGDRLFLHTSSGAGLSDARPVTGSLRGRLDGRWLQPSAPSFGTANTFALNQDIVINEIMYNPRALEGQDPVPAVVQTSALLDWNAVWRYNQSGADPGNTWETTAHPAGAGWQSGVGPLGYETSAGVPSRPLGTVLTDPLSANPYPTTYFFESDFTLTAQQIAAISSLRLSHEIDDGAIFYLNGHEISRFAMPAEPVTAATLSTGGNDAVLTGPAELPGAAAFLVPGVNRLSVEVHQNSSDSSDIVFATRLEAVETITPAQPGLPFRNSDEQWIELYNKGSATVDLGGWALSDGVSFVFPAGTTLAADGYLIVARDPASMAAEHPSIQILGPFDGSLSRSGERLRLEDAAGNPADEVRYADGGSWPGAADGEGSSMELRDPRAANDAPGSWAASDESARRVWQSYTYTARATSGQNDPTQYNEFIFGLLDSGEILLDDISVIESPAGTARQLIQNGSFESGTGTGWRFLGTHRHAEVIPDPDNAANKVLRLRASGASEHMHNHAETTLKSGSSFVSINGGLDYQISFRAKWLSGSNQLNTRLYFNRAARVTRLAAQPDGGTPGAPNSVRAANIGPSLTNLTHSPAVPAAGEPATVSVTAGDPDGVSGLTLHYAVNGAASFTATPMTSQGQGRWTGTVPAQSSGAKVQFYVSARDTQDAVALCPAKGPDSRAMIPWDDGQANLDYGPVQPNNLRIVMTTADATFMHTSTQVMSNDRLPCTVIYNENEIYYDCGVRLKGSQRGRPKDVRVGFTVGFPADRPFLGAHGTVAVDRSGAGDQFSQKEILVKHAAARAGRIPSMNDDLIRIIAPKSAHTGSAILLKSRFDDEWLDNIYDNGGDGRMFEYELIYYPTTTTGGAEGLKLPEPDNVAGVDVRLLGGLSKELHRWHWLVDNNRDADDYSSLLRMLQTFGLSGQAYRDALPQAIDVDQWLRAFALQTLFGIGDSYSSGSQHNLLVYFRPDDGRGLYFPWDMDFTFEMGSTSGVVNNGDLSNMLNASPAYYRAYYGHLHDLIQTVYNPAYMTPWAQHYSQFLPSEDLTGYLSYISTRRSHVQNLINSAVPAAAYAITTPNGASTTGSSITIQGTGWVDVAEIRLVSTGASLPVTWTTRTAWSVSVPVAPGSSTIALAAYDARGNLLGTASVTVQGTGSTVPASSGNLAVSEVMYHPADPSAAEQAAGYTDAEQFEFIELVNTTENLTVSLAGASFTNGIAVNLPSSTLAPGARTVIARNPDAFAFRYGTGLAAPGGFGTGTSPALSNSGEAVTLSAADGGVITSFTYSDLAPWPVDADGAGWSLTAIRPGSADPDDPASWRTSALPGGTPGTTDSVRLSTWLAGYGVADALADPDGDGLPALTEYAAGFAPSSSVSAPPVSLAWVDILGTPFPAISFVQKIGTDDVHPAAEIAGTLGEWRTAATGDLVFLGRRNNGDSTETLLWRATTPAAAAPRFFRIRLTGPTPP